MFPAFDIKQLVLQDLVQSQQLKPMSCNVLDVVGSTTNYKEVLDLCCGTANVLSYKLETDNIDIYTGIDFDPTSIAMAKIRYPTFNFIHGDILQIDLRKLITPETIITCFSNTLLGFSRSQLANLLRTLASINPQALLFAMTPSEKLGHIYSYSKWIAIQNDVYPDLKIRVEYDERVDVLEQYVVFDSSFGTFINKHVFNLFSMLEIKSFLYENGWRVIQWFDSCSLTPENMDTSRCEALIYAVPNTPKS